MPTRFDAFISYGRADSTAFVQKLNDRLTELGLDVWVDFNDIPLGVDYQSQIDDGLARSDNVLFVISPHSVNSPYCAKELDWALACQKRIIPILHVEHISYDTWRDRHPTAPLTDWQADQAAGKHSAFPNMHPDIARINWVYMRDGQDDFAAGVQGIIEIFERHRVYVRQHTGLLVKALEWDQQRRRSRYLLIGEERQQAEQWLRTQFPEQPPCLPTDLHCEYITASIKNAQNLMTQVFLSHASEDSEPAFLIRKSLMRDGITVWTNEKDIQTGRDFQTAIERGIEAADNFVFMISPAALRSHYCQQELAYAQQLHKRIIPVLACPTPLETIPRDLEVLQYIDLTDNVAPGDYRQDEDELLTAIYREAGYYHEHKVLLVKALKWQRQNQNPSVLLRGYNLRHAEAWLKGARSREQSPALPIQAEFIAASLQQPPGVPLDVFISYSRADSDFARPLNDALQSQGKTTWFDQESIASGADFQQEIERGIASADNFLFILTPRSLRSPYCADEVAQAAQLNKRIIPVLYRAIDGIDLPEPMARIQWIDFQPETGDFHSQFNQLVRVLDTDRDHVRYHTKCSQRALEWEADQRGPDLLLRGNEFAVAETWLQDAQEAAKQPAPTPLQIEFITASRAALQQAKRAERRRILILRSLLGLVSTAFLVSVGIGQFAMRQKTLAERVQEGQIRALSRYGQSLMQSDLSFDAVIEAVRAGQLLRQRQAAIAPDTRQQVVSTLQEALYSSQELTRLDGHVKKINTLALSADEQWIITASEDRTARIWSIDGRQQAQIDHADEVWGAEFHPTQPLALTRSRDRTVRLWSLDGELQQAMRHPDEVWEAQFTPQGDRIVTASRDGVVRIWGLDGSLERQIAHAQAWGFQFTEDGQHIITHGGNGRAILWNLTTHQQAQTFAHDRLWAVHVSPDGEHIATRSEDGSVKIWTLAGKEIGTFQQEGLWDIRFHPQGDRLLTRTANGTVTLWDLTGQSQLTLNHEVAVNVAEFMPDRRTILTASQSGRITLWDLDGNEIERITLPDEVRIVLPRTQADHLLIVSGKMTVILWNLNHEVYDALRGHQDVVRRVVISPNHRLATVSSDGTARLWNRHGDLLQVLPHSDIVNRATFAPDFATLITGTLDGQVHFWNLERNTHQVISGLNDTVYDVVTSPTGDRLAIGHHTPVTYYSNVTLFTATGTPLKTLTAQWSPVFSSDGTRLMTSNDKYVYLWSRDGILLNVLSGHADVIRKTVFSPDGQWILTASDDRTAKLWTQTGTLVQTYTHEETVRDVAFSPDGTTLVTASEDGRIHYWQRDGRLLRSIPAHSAAAFQVLVSRDGNTIFSAGNDNLIRLWSLDGQLLLTLRQNAEILQMSLSPDNRQLAVATLQDYATVWNVDLPRLHELVTSDRYLDTLLSEACDRIRGYLENKPETDSDRLLCDGVTTLDSGDL